MKRCGHKRSVRSPRNGNGLAATSATLRSGAVGLARTATTWTGLPKLAAAATGSRPKLFPPSVISTKPSIHSSLNSRLTWERAVAISVRRPSGAGRAGSDASTCGTAPSEKT